MRRIGAIHRETATAQAGVFLGEFQREIEETGRFYPPDPTSRHECTLGASIACNASGARSFKYGPTRPWVQSARVVLPDGNVIDVDRQTPVPSSWPVPRWDEPPVKTAAGYSPAENLLDLFIGQEGTLGIITSATVRLTALPPDVIGLLLFFESRDAALALMEHARSCARQGPAGALSPRCIEYLDQHCLGLARERVGDIPKSARIALFCEQEVEAGVGVDAHLEAWWAALEQSRALVDDTLVTTDPAGQARLHALRHAVPAGINEQVVRNGMPKVGTDLAVPDCALAEMMDAYESAPMRHALFGHVGDNHLHLNLLPTTQEELVTAKSFYKELATRALRLGGTISAEHGIGKLKTELLASMVGPQTLAGFQRLKHHLDPAWILGRGTLLCADGPQESVEL